MNGRTRLASPAGPDFLVIGAQRAATTWLANSLRTHPDLWIPPRKELHYFDRAAQYPSPNHLGEDRSAFTAIGELISGRGRFRLDLARALRNRSRQDVQWVLRYYAGHPNNDWYRRLFEPAGGKLSGELTPEYAILSPADVGEVYSVVPNSRIVFVMRDPIDRAWSQVRRVAEIHNRSLSTNWILQHCARPFQMARSDYATTIDYWRGIFGASQVWLGTYDEIQSDADSFLARLGSYLEVDADHFRRVPRINSSTSLAIPLAVERGLAEVFEPLLERTVAQVVGDPVESIVDGWLRRCRSIVTGK